jgi:polyferredoxin
MSSVGEKLRKVFAKAGDPATRKQRSDEAMALPVINTGGPEGGGRTQRQMERIRTAVQTAFLFFLTFTVLGHMMGPLLPVLPLVLPDPQNILFGADRGIVTQYSISARALGGVWPLHWALLTVGGALLFGAVFGRVMCGWACPIGFMQDIFSGGRRRLGLKDREPSEKLHSRLLLLKYVSLGMTLTLAASIGIATAIDPVGGDKYTESLGPFGGHVPMKFMSLEGNLYAFLNMFAVGAPAFNLVFGLQIGVFVLVMGGILVTPRFYCRYMCRTGALIALTSRYSLLQIRKRQSSCDHRKSCETTCPMGRGQDRYVPGVNDEVQERFRDSTNCSQTYRCVTACPTPTLQVRFGELPVLVPRPWNKEQKGSRGAVAGDGEAKGGKSE